MAEEISYVLWTQNEQNSLETIRLYREMNLKARRGSCQNVVGFGALLQFLVWFDCFQREHPVLLYIFTETNSLHIDLIIIASCAICLANIPLHNGSSLNNSHYKYFNNRNSYCRKKNMSMVNF